MKINAAASTCLGLATVTSIIGLSCLMAKASLSHIQASLGHVFCHFSICFCYILIDIHGPQHHGQEIDFRFAGSRDDDYDNVEWDQDLLYLMGSCLFYAPRPQCINK